MGYEPTARIKPIGRLTATEKLTFSPPFFLSSFQQTGIKLAGYVPRSSDGIAGLLYFYPELSISKFGWQVLRTTARPVLWSSSTQL